MLRAPNNYYAFRADSETAELLGYLQQRFGPVSSFSGSYRADRWVLNINRTQGSSQQCKCSIYYLHVCHSFAVLGKPLDKRFCGFYMHCLMLAQQIPAIINPRRACARVTVVVLSVCVCVSVCSRSSCFSSIGTSEQRYSTGLGIICEEFRKNLPLKSYGVKKPICK